MSSKTLYYDTDGTCCPSCCLAGDFGVHDYCLPCATNPCCPTSVARSDYEDRSRENFDKYFETAKDESVKEKSPEKKSSKEKSPKDESVKEKSAAAGDGGKDAKK
ncbi:hypothetical protein QQZ08_008285 [Neonectria magnoliae]|uniref:Uncharacterized protein n=1 Tax=Neonectria magnoliae TaxID=2732573 RepID=A0ABR1HWC8_9HYPO